MSNASRRNSSAVTSVDSLAELKKIVASNDIVVADFYATWCGPCMAIKPHFRAFAEKMPSVRFVEVNVEDAEDAAGEYRIKALPSFILFNSGAKQRCITGADMDTVKSAVQAMAKSAGGKKEKEQGGSGPAVAGKASKHDKIRNAKKSHVDSTKKQKKHRRPEPS